MTRNPRNKLSALAALIVPLVLAGCGGGAAPPKAAGEQVVFVTSADCAETGTLKPEECTDALKSSLAQHLAKSPTYKSLATCEKTEGTGRCEKMNEALYRARLMATSVDVTMIEPARQKKQKIPVTPLYAMVGGEPGFRTMAKTTLKAGDDLVKFTPKAVAAYSSLVKTKKAAVSAF